MVDDAVEGGNYSGLAVVCVVVFYIFAYLIVVGYSPDKVDRAGRVNICWRRFTFVLSSL